MPSWPWELLPQHLTPPAPVVPGAIRWPMAATAKAVSSTGTGFRRSCRSPSRPPWPARQRLAPPALVIAQLWARPAATAATPPISPVTSTGTGLLVLLPLPNSPLLLSPQHLAPPAVVTAQVWYPPAATILAIPKTQASPPSSLSRGPPMMAALPLAEPLPPGLSAAVEAAHHDGACAEQGLNGLVASFGLALDPGDHRRARPARACLGLRPAGQSDRRRRRPRPTSRASISSVPRELRPAPAIFARHTVGLVDG